MSDTTKYKRSIDSLKSVFAGTNKEAKVSKVKLVAIAKDEAAYLPEWIYHHLESGFDSIDVYINRTQDNSAEVMRKIEAEYPQVTHHFADWIDTCGAVAAKRMQFIIYAKALHECQQSDEFSHICLLDVDEFWIHQKSLDIKTYIEQTGPSKVIFLQWLVDHPCDTAFTTLQSKFAGKGSILGKCILPVATNVTFMKLHIPEFGRGTKVVLANGKKFVANDTADQAIAKNHAGILDSFVFHRAHRSEKEYVSLTLRGRASSDFPFKENRNGLPDKSEGYQDFSIANPLYQSREANLSAFIEQCGLADDLKTAQAFVLKRYSSAISQLPAVLASHYEMVKKIFIRVSDKAVLDVFKAHRASLARGHENDADFMRDLARDAVHQDIDEGIYYIERALEVRPKGPLIIKLREKFLAQKALLQLEMHNQEANKSLKDINTASKNVNG